MNGAALVTEGVEPGLSVVAVGASSGLKFALLDVPVVPTGALSVNRVGGGNIPGNFPVVDFYTGDGDWAPVLRLPASAAAGATITIHANATWDSNVQLDNTDLPMRTLTLRKGDRTQFRFDAGQRRWIASISEYVPTGASATVPASGARTARVSIGEGSTVRQLTLPATAEPGAILIVASKSALETRIEAQNVLHASTLRLAAGERYVFAFHPDLKKWYPIESAVAALGAQQLRQGIMPAVTRARTELTLAAGTPTMAIRLPAGAGDRDRVRIRSNAAQPQNILNDGIAFAGTLRITQGDTYDFMWVAEKNRWVVMAAPTRIQDVGALASAGGQMPVMTAPTTRLRAWDGNWLPRVALPQRARPGDRVIVESSSSWGLSIVPGSMGATFGSQPVGNGDTMAFIVDAQGRWSRETLTIDMLNIYADKVAATYGATAARARQLESFRLTNEALENSRANFRLRMVGLMQHRDQGATLGDALNKLRTDAVVQNERRRLKADAIYYEGAESGCGLAWVNSTPSAFNMVASGSIACGTTVMRHEFGHNMGLSHGGDVGSPVYAVGYSLLSTVMGGNGIPYYATPALYDSQLGVAMGVPQRIDAVRAMNEHAETVANFYR